VLGYNNEPDAPSRTEGYAPSHDIKQFDFTKDLAFGHEGEELVTQFLADLSQGSFEVKYDRFRNGRIFVEFEQNPRNSGWKPSGIAVTEARWWVYLFAPTAFAIIEVPRLKRYLKHNVANIRQLVAAPDSDNPAKGFLLYPDQVRELMTLSAYD
jgi:hypothetical protein